jgi:hypothetical protein
MIYDTSVNINLVNIIDTLSERNVMIKILTDNSDIYDLKQINKFSNKYKEAQINLGFLNKLNNIHEMIIIVVDNKYVIQLRYDEKYELIATFSRKR